MSGNNPTEIQRKIILDGIALLKRQKYYKQATIVYKLRYLNCNTSEATLSNIINGKYVGEETIVKVLKGVQTLIERELGLFFEDGEFINKTEAKKWEPEEIPSLSINEPSLVQKPGFAYNEEGRVSISQKKSLLAEAQHEIIEFGLTLRTYSSHFFSRNDSEFYTPVSHLLERGVNIKCYLLSPESNEARLYFEDRKRVLKEEGKGSEVIKQSIEKLRKVQARFNEEGYKGQFEIYTYKHIPYNYFMVVDGAHQQGKMIISHYIYGELRAKCPVVEFDRKHNPSLFRRYMTSLQYLTRDAQLIK